MTKLHLCSFLLTLILATGCTSTKIFVANAPTYFSNYTEHENITYGQEDWQSLNVLSHPESKGDEPVVIFIHGGNWKYGNKDDYMFVGETLSAMGYVAVVPDYIKYPDGEFPQFIDDAALAVKWVHENIDKYGGDKNKIFLAGHSAGAHIAGLVAADESYLKNIGGDSDWIKGVIGMAGPYAFNPSDYKLSKIFGGKKNFANSQVINFIDGKEPPFLLLHGMKDKTVMPKQSEWLEQRINDRKGKVKLITYDEIDHVGLVAEFTAYFRDKSKVVKDVRSFIDDTR